MAKDFGKRVVSQIKGIFRIPSYQRGYRWTSDEIVRLLDDIYEHRESSNSYYLQPIVVKNLSDDNTPKEEVKPEPKSQETESDTGGKRKRRRRRGH